MDLDFAGRMSRPASISSGDSNVASEVVGAEEVGSIEFLEEGEGDEASSASDWADLSSAMFEESSSNLSWMKGI